MIRTVTLTLPWSAAPVVTTAYGRTGRALAHDVARVVRSFARSRGVSALAVEWSMA